MTLAVPPNKWKQLQKLLEMRGVEATAIGTFTSENRCVVTYQGKNVMDMNMKFLHQGLPVRALAATFPAKTPKNPVLPHLGKMSSLFLEILGRPNIASYDFISMQYDHEVQGTSVVKPLVGMGRVHSDAQVMRPVLSSKRGVVVSQGLYPTYSDIDTYHMAACAIDTAIRNVVSAGADFKRIVLLDNFCWPSGDDPRRVGELIQAARACFDYAVAYKTPFISGKDSMFNDFSGFDGKNKQVKISIPPTLLISAIGTMTDVRKAVTSDAKAPGDLVYLLGETHDELGGSEYFALLSDRQKKWAMGKSVPHVNAQVNRKLYARLAAAIDLGLIASAQSVHRGGVAVAIAKTALGGLTGVDVDLSRVADTAFPFDSMLFSESQGRILVTVAPQYKKQFEDRMTGTMCRLIGHVADDQFIRIRGRSPDTFISHSISEAQREYKGRFKNY